MFKFARDMTISVSKAIRNSVSVPKDLDSWRSKLLWASRVLPMPLVGRFFIQSVCAHPYSLISEFPEMKALFRLDLAAAMKVFLAKLLTSMYMLCSLLQFLSSERSDHCLLFNIAYFV
jgi:hypothetical protein